MNRMKSVMPSGRSPVDARCREIRERLADFAADRLGPTATGEVQGHLLDCQACSEVFGELLLAEVESGAIPLLTPPVVPPLELYDRYLRSSHSRFGTLWTSVRGALKSKDVELREWARSQMDQIRRGIDALALSSGPLPAAVRTRGAAVRTRGTVRRESPTHLMADVLSAEGEPTGARVAFRVQSAPAITADGRFAATLRTDSAEYDDRLVICTMALPDAPRVSFGGALQPVPGEAVREVRIDEVGVPGPARAIPLQHVTLAIVAG